MKARQARIFRTGGPEVIEWVEVDLPAPGPGEVLVEHTAVGLNMIDTYHRSGIYPVPLPSGLGVEAAGRVLATGPGVTGIAEGDRVSTFGPDLGAYASARIYPADWLFRLPDSIDEDRKSVV